MSDTLAPQPRAVEFVCGVCLRSKQGTDTGRWPRCPAGHSGSDAGL